MYGYTPWNAWLEKFDCSRVEIPFSSVTAEFFEDDDLHELMQSMFGYMKTHEENSLKVENFLCGFALDRIMHSHINFHKLVLTRGSSSIELWEWIPKKKAVINQKNNTGSACREPLLQHYITKRLGKTHSVYQSYNMKINTTRMG